MDLKDLHDPRLQESDSFRITDNLTNNLSKSRRKLEEETVKLLERR